MFKINELLKATKGKLVGSRITAAVKGISIDSRSIRPQEAFIAVKGANFDGHDFIDEAIKKGATCIIHQSPVTCHQSPSTAFIKVKDTIRALGDVARFKREKFNLPVIAVTGSNGKTTAKEMIACVLSKKFKVLKNEGTKNNHIGLPCALLNLDSSYDVAVLEIGTNHFGEVGYLAGICRPNIGVITNIGLSHLEYFRDTGGILREKYALVENLKVPAIAVLNIDDNLLRRQAVRDGQKQFILGFGAKSEADFSVSDSKFLKEKIEFLVNRKHRFTLKTLGLHNIYNALSAIAVARLFGLGYADIASLLATFNFPQGRLNLRKINKIKFIDDTYNSNPTSLKEALSVLDNFSAKGRKIFVMGDMLELGEQQDSFHRQAGFLASRVCDAFVTVGSSAKLAASAAKAAGLKEKKIFICKTPLEARDVLFNKISPQENDIILVKGSRAMKMEEVFKV